MAVLQATACGGTVYNPLWPRRHMQSLLKPLIDDMPPDKPIVVYVHGHKAWPHPDLLAQADRQSGLAITFCWPAFDRIFKLVPDVGQLYADAGTAALALAWLLNLLGDIAPNRPVDLMVHSLGARVGLQTLRHLKHRNLSRFVCLAGVEFSAVTLLALQAPAARKVEFYNVTSERSLLFHQLMHFFGPRPGPAEGLLCRGFAFPRKNWIDIHLEAPEVRRPLATFCAALDTITLDLGMGRKPALISQLGSALMQNRNATRISDLRDLLGPAIPGALTMIPLRTPRMR
ncbi:MAG: alpha/beta hydrolase [Rhodobacteraceae bacterium]|nr:alpha/beta hydrolase [Paracoccaceae bacterium]